MPTKIRNAEKNIVYCSAQKTDLNALKQMCGVNMEIQYNDDGIENIYIITSKGKKLLTEKSIVVKTDLLEDTSDINKQFEVFDNFQEFNKKYYSYYEAQNKIYQKKNI